MSITSENKKIIKAVKARLSEVKIKDVLSLLGYSRVNLHKHLDEKRAHNINHDAILKISDAIDKVKRNAEKESYKKILLLKSKTNAA